MRATCWVRSRSTSACATLPGAHPADRPAHQIRQRQARGARLGVPLGTLRLAGADLHPHGASSAHDAPLPLVGSGGGTAPRQLPPGTREVWPRRVCWLSRLSGVRKARPPQPRTLRLNASHRPLRRAHAAWGSRLGPPSRRLPPKRCPPPTLLDPVADVLGAERPLPPAQVDDGIAGLRVELLLQRLHNRDAEAPFARKSTRRKYPIICRRPMLSERVRGRLDTAASGSLERPRRPCRLFSGHGNLMRMSRWTPKRAILPEELRQPFSGGAGGVDPRLPNQLREFRFVGGQDVCVAGTAAFVAWSTWWERWPRIPSTMRCSSRRVPCCPSALSW